MESLVNLWKDFSAGMGPFGSDAFQTLLFSIIFKIILLQIFSSQSLAED